MRMGMGGDKGSQKKSELDDEEGDCGRIPDSTGVSSECHSWQVVQQFANSIMTNNVIHKETISTMKHNLLITGFNLPLKV